MESLMSNNAIREISENITTTHPVQVQIHSFDSDPQIKNNNSFFKAKVSDGYTYQNVLLKNPPQQLQTLLQHRQVQPIIKVNKWSSDGLTLIIITELEIVDPNFKDSIGNPLPYDQYKRNNYQNLNGNNEKNKNKSIKIKLINKQGQIIQKQYKQVDQEDKGVEGQKQLQQQQLQQQQNKEKTQIQEHEDNIQFNQSQIKNIKVEQVEQLKHDEKCNLLVIVRDVKKIKQYRDIYGEIQQKITYQIYDQTGQINVTFLGEKAEKCKFRVGQIISLRQLRVVVYHDVKQLLGTNKTEVLTTNQGLVRTKDYVELRQMYAKQINSSGLMYNKYKKRNLKDIEEELYKNIRNVNYKLYSVVACKNVENKEANLLPFCRRCHKNCETVNNYEFICPSPLCRLILIRPVWKLTLKIKLIDRSGSLCGTFIQGCGYQLLNVKAQQYINYNDEIKQQVLSTSLNQFNLYFLATSIKKQGETFEIIHKVKDFQKLSNQQQHQI